MINFPEEFVALKDYPGYFWNKKEQHLYTMKVQGFLRPLTFRRPSSFNKWSEPGYEISKNGRRGVIRLSQIASMLESDHTIPVR